MKTTPPTLSPRQLLLAFALALPYFLALDAVWLSSTSTSLYQPSLGHLMAPQVDWRAAALFYPLYVAGLVYFAVVPGWQAGRTGAAGLRGAFLGLVAYATYDLTNQATLRGWSWHITLMDLAWGTVLTATTSAVATWLLLRLTSRP